MQTVLMFSGGRDSTLAAMRLHAAGHDLTLITVSTGHLLGIENVNRRLTELRQILPPETRWLQIEQPEDLKTDVSFYERTCLPCQQAYVVVAAAVASKLGASSLALGYAGYQATWPEQTPLAVERLEATLRRHSIRLLLPVYELDSRDRAIAELGALGLSSASLEQKCTRQVNNVALPESTLRQQIALWEAAIDRSIERLADIRITILRDLRLGELR